MADPTQAELAALVIDVVARLTQLMSAMSDWAVGTPDGGPNGDGRYPFPQPDGTVILVPCPTKGGSASSADGVAFDDTQTQLGATNVQEAIEAVRAIVTGAAVALQPLGIATPSIVLGAAAGAPIGAVTGLTAGSALALVDDADGRVALSGTQLVVGPNAPGAPGQFAITLRETLAGALGSPRSTTLAITVASIASYSAFGDSFVAGANASDEAHRWANLVATALGAATLRNKGIGGTVLQNSPDAGGSARANNGRDRFVSDLLGGNRSDAVAIAYGYNDGRYTAGGQINAGNYLADYREVLNGLLAGGYARSKITVVSPGWISDTGLQTGTSGFSGQSRAGFEAYVAAAAQVAGEYGVLYADSYAAMRDNGGAALISSDNIHPNNSGHQVIATCVLAAAPANTRAVPRALAASSPASGQLDFSWIAPAAGAVASYTAEVGLAGSYAYPSSQVVTDLDAAFTGLAAGSYSARVRATLTDGSRTPWVFLAAPVAVAGIDDAAAAYVAALTVPATAERQAAINSLFIGLRSAGLLPRLKALHLIAAADVQAGLLNARAPGSWNLTAVGGPAFTADRGQLFNGSSQYDDTGYAFPDEVKAGCHFGLWSLTPGQAPLAAVDMGNALAVINCRGSNDTLIFRLNAGQSVGLANADGSGMFNIVRTGASQTKGYRNGQYLGLSNAAVATPDTNPLRVGGRSGTVSYSSRRIAASWWGETNLTDGDVATFYGLMHDYMAAVGAV